MFLGQQNEQPPVLTCLFPPTPLADWRCPMCRDLCNCSFHRSKRGWAPTGTLYRHAIAEGERCVRVGRRVMGATHWHNVAATRQH